MCGIVAIYNYQSSRGQVDILELRRMRDYMARRGPDGKGEWFSDDCRVGLGHRRLSIIDLSDVATQPMKSADGRLILVFNGEIYNYKELRFRLEKKGFIFYSDSDTEVILNLYLDMGESMLAELRGMFAISLWDTLSKSMLLARDPYGIKPLYYSDDGSTIRVASQVKALEASGDISLELQPAGIVGFFLFGSVPDPYTIRKHIYAVPAGSFIRINENGVSVTKEYFSLSRVFDGVTLMSGFDSTSNVKDASDFVHKCLLDSVSAHLVSDVPVGVFLSSGIDSSVIAALACESGYIGFESLTLAFDEFEGGDLDESPLAKYVADYYGIRNVKRVLGAKEFSAEIPSFFESMDQPSIDGINSYFVSKAATEQGWKVALSGVGGDELFGGYPSFSDIPRLVKTLKVPSQVPLLGDIVSAMIGPVASRFLNPKLAGLVKYGGSYQSAYLLKKCIFLPEELGLFLDQDIVRQGLIDLSPVSYLGERMSIGCNSSYAKIASLESSVYMRNQLLRDADWAGMAHSLEIRTPLVDSQLLSSMAPFLLKHKTGFGKKYLAMAPHKKLPDNILYKSKTGFSVPMNKWLKNDSQLDDWKKIPFLNQKNCPWARKWAYVVMNRFLKSSL